MTNIFCMVKYFRQQIEASDIASTAVPAECLTDSWTSRLRQLDEFGDASNPAVVIFA